MDKDDVVECTMIGGGIYHLRPKTVSLNNKAVDTFILQAGSIENAKKILEDNYCWKDAELFLEKKVQAPPIYYAFLRYYSKVNKLEKHISYLQRVIGILKNAQTEEKETTVIS